MQAALRCNVSLAMIQRIHLQHMRHPIRRQLVSRVSCVPLVCPLPLQRFWYWCSTTQCCSHVQLLWHMKHASHRSRVADAV